MNPLRWSFRSAFLLGLLVCVGLLGFAWYSQWYLGQQPCNLCILQRVAFVWMGLWFLIGGLHGPRRGGRWVYRVLVVAGAIFGIAIAVRQLWLQSLPPDQVPACGAGFSMLWAQMRGSYIPVSEFLVKMFSGTGDCAQVSWRFLGLSMAGWTTIWYVLLAVWALWPRPRRGTFGDVQPVRPLRS